jgi:hypothetical protein
MMIDQLSKAVLEETGDISSQSHLLISTVGWDLCGPWRQQEGYCGCVNHFLNMGKQVVMFLQIFPENSSKNGPLAKMQQVEAGQFQKMNPTGPHDVLHLFFVHQMT